MIIAAVLSERWSSAVFYKKKQREEDKRMKKKVLAFLLASTMVIEPFTVASAADFSDSMGQDIVQFSDDAEDVPEVENDDVDQFDTDVAGADDSTLLTFEEVRSGWISYDELNVKGVINKDALYYVTYVEKGKSAPDYDENHEKLSTNEKIFSTTIKIPLNPVDIYVFVADKEGNHISDKLTPNYKERNAKYQMGDNVWFTFDDSTGTVTISGTGDMWDYYEDGWDAKKEHKNPLPNIRGIRKIVFSDGITSVSDLLLLNYNDRYMIESISFGKNIKRIGYSAFENCRNLTSITFPESLEEIGDQSFIGCGLISIVIPDSVKKAGTNCFTGCENLKSVKISKNLLTIPEYMFSQCPRLENINMADSIKKIDDAAFKGCGVVNLQLPSNLEYMGYGAFAGCMSISKIMLPATIKHIEGEAFNGCKRLTTVNFEDGFSCDIGQDMFKNCDNLEAIEIPNGVKYIGPNSFANCRKLSEITIPSTVTSIYNNAFSGCDSLQTIKGYTGSYAETFANNNGINFDPIGGEAPEPPAPTGMKINVGNNAVATVAGNTVTITGTGETYDACWWADINDSANELDKTSIKHIIVEDGITSLGSRLFRNFNNVETIELPASLTKIKNWTFQNCRSLKSISIPEGVTEIGNGIFDECNNLKSISFPSTLNTIPYLGGIDEDDGLNVETIIMNKGIKEIGTSAFSRMNNLKSITIPDSITRIGQYAFENCTALSNLTLPDSITEIAVEAFSNCVSLGKVTLPKNLTLLGDGVFEKCNAEIIFPASLKCIPIMGDNAVTKVTIPEGVKMISEEAFAYCSNFTEITLPSTITNIERSAFFNTPITEFIYPQNIDNIPASAFGGTKLTEFSVPDNVKEIDDGAFYNCTDLKKITIPEFVTYIGNDVFKNCRNLVIYGKRDSVAERYAYINNIKFVSGQYKVVFKDNGRTVHTYYIDEGGSVLTPPTLKEKPGYTLSWDADYTNIQEDMVINAVWTKKDNGGGNTTIIVSPSETNKYTVTFKDRGEVIKTEKVKSGDAAEYPFITRSGYKLSWDKDFSKVTANITVNAVWTVIKPEKVTSLTAESGKKSIALSWDETEYAGYYLVYRKADSEKEYTQVAKTTKILWTDSKAVPGTQYSYKVVAVRSLSGKKYQGAESDVVTTKIGTPQIGDTYSVGDLNYKLTGTKEVTVTGLAKVTDTLVIPSSVTISGKVYKVTAIQDKAFYRNEDIVNVTIGNNVVNVGKYAFYQCSGLETVKFGKRVAIINTCAFTQCPNLENVTLPSSIRKIGAKAFYQCTSIKIFKINGSVLEYVGKKGLAVNKSVTLKLPKKVYTRYKKLIKASNIYSKTKFTKF